MDVTAVFTPVAVELIDRVFPSDVVFHQHGSRAYDPVSGAVVGADTDHVIKAGVLSRNRVEQGGTSEAYDISIWVHHGATGLGFLPTTADSFSYNGVVWRIVEVSPTYSGTGLIASRIKGRAA